MSVVEGAMRQLAWSYFSARHNTPSQACEELVHNSQGVMGLHASAVLPEASLSSTSLLAQHHVLQRSLVNHWAGITTPDGATYRRGCPLVLRREAGKPLLLVCVGGILEVLTANLDGTLMSPTYILVLHAHQSGVSPSSDGLGWSVLGRVDSMCLEIMDNPAMFVQLPLARYHPSCELVSVHLISCPSAPGVKVAIVPYHSGHV